VLQELSVQGVQFVCCRNVIYRVFMCCRNFVYRVFNIYVAETLYTGCSIYVLQERYIQGV